MKGRLIAILTYLLIPWSIFLLQKLTGSQLAKKVPAFYGTQSFITAFTSARHLSLTWASSIQPMLPHPTSWRSIIIVSSHLRLGLSSALFPSGFPTKILYHISSPLRMLHTKHMQYNMQPNNNSILWESSYRNLGPKSWLSRFLYTLRVCKMLHVLCRFFLSNACSKYSWSFCR